MAKEEAEKEGTEVPEETPESPIDPEVLQAARDEAVVRRNALQQAVDAGYAIVSTEIDDGAYVLVLEKEGETRRARLHDDGELRFTK